MSSDVLKRNNVKVSGSGNRVIMFSHGFGCDQNMWRYVAPAFETSFKVVLFDHVGAGYSDQSAYSFAKYESLEGYASDIVEILQELEMANVIFVGHSVSSMIGLLASQQAPGLIGKLIMVGPSPSYINDGEYTGGFTRNQINELLESLDNNHLGWSSAMAPVIMGNPDRPELSEELTNSFCRTNPDIAKHFARTTFLSDNRKNLSENLLPTLILQCSNDVIAPIEVGKYVHRETLNSELVILKANGHCPNLSAPQETIAAIMDFLKDESGK